MARELVLVPKSKYEHLLKLMENSKHTEQIEQKGGQQENRDENLLKPDLEETSSQERQMTSDNIDEKSTEQLEKAKLYVDKPLSKMPFDKIKFTRSPNIKKKGVKRIGNGKRKTRRSDGLKKGGKLQWINYTI